MTVFENLSDIHANANAGIDVVRSGAYDYVRSTTGKLESVVWAGVPFDAATAQAKVFENTVYLEGDSGDNILRGDLYAYAGTASAALVFANQITLSGLGGNDMLAYAVRVTTSAPSVTGTVPAQVTNNDIRLSGGLGQDSLVLSLTNSNGLLAGNQFNLSGDSGNDALTVNIDDLSQLRENNISIAGGEGSDRGGLNYFGDTSLILDFSSGYDQNIYGMGLAGVEAVQILAGSGNDRLIGGIGDDVLGGGAGRDRLDGGSGADVMFGGGGDDTFVVSQLGDIVIEQEGEGSDRVLSQVSFTLGAHLEILQLTTSAALDGTGNATANSLIGNRGDNILSGLAGSDALVGGEGDDILIGGRGKDHLTGGEGNDVFVFSDGDSGTGGGTRDVVTDFQTGYDLIDISDLAVANMEDLTFKTVGGGTIVYADTNGDGINDFALQLSGVFSLSEADFLFA